MLGDESEDGDCDEVICTGPDCVQTATADNSVCDRGSNAVPGSRQNIYLHSTTSTSEHNGLIA